MRNLVAAAVQRMRRPTEFYGPAPNNVAVAKRSKYGFLKMRTNKCGQRSKAKVTLPQVAILK
jgi:hypothetical protein